MTDDTQAAREAFRAQVRKQMREIEERISVKPNWFDDFVEDVCDYFTTRLLSSSAAAALLREAGWTVEEPKCETCKGEKRVLIFWDRPGGVPGNGYIPCPTCNGPGARKVTT